MQTSSTEYFVLRIRFDLSPDGNAISGGVCSSLRMHAQEISVKSTKLTLKRVELSFEYQINSISHFSPKALIGSSYDHNKAGRTDSLEHEASMMLKGSCQYVLSLIGIYKNPERSEHGLVMHFMENGSLENLLTRQSQLPWPLKFQIIHQVALGMNFLHTQLPKPILHLDLKPSNVLLNESFTVQLTDFGLSEVAHSCSSFQSEHEGGTLSYMPPEALVSKKYRPMKAFDVYRKYRNILSLQLWTQASPGPTHIGIAPPEYRRVNVQYPGISIHASYINGLQIGNNSQMIITKSPGRKTIKK
ncbi:RIPK4 kinase, partial [Polypterus senegalus]